MTFRDVTLYLEGFPGRGRDVRERQQDLRLVADGEVLGAGGARGLGELADASLVLGGDAELVLGALVQPRYLVGRLGDALAQVRLQPLERSSRLQQPKQETSHECHSHLWKANEPSESSFF